MRVRGFDGQMSVGTGIKECNVSLKCCEQMRGAALCCVHCRSAGKENASVFCKEKFDGFIICMIMS